MYLLRRCDVPLPFYLPLISRVIINAFIARSPSSLRSGGSKLPKCCIPYRLLVGNWPVAGVRLYYPLGVRCAMIFYILGTIDSRFLKTDTGVLTQELPGNARLH